MSKRAASASSRPKFQCQLCASTFSRKDNLKTHQRLHSGEMPFQCKYCGRKFRWQSSARTHEQVHERHGHVPRPELAAAADAARNSPAPRVKVESVVHAYSSGTPSTYSAAPVTHSYSNPPPVTPSAVAAAPATPRTYSAPSMAYSNIPPTIPPVSLPYAPSTYIPQPQQPPIASNPLLYSSSAPQQPASSAIAVLPPTQQAPPPMYSSSSTTSTTTTYTNGSMLPLHPPPLYTAASRPLHPLPARALPPRRVGIERTIRKPRSASTAAAAGLLSLDFEEVMGEVGAALQTSITHEGQTPQQAHGESPMFNLPNMSQQDIEKCLEPPHPNQPPTSQQ